MLCLKQIKLKILFSKRSSNSNSLNRKQICSKKDRKRCKISKCKRIDSSNKKKKEKNPPVLWRSCNIFVRCQINTDKVLVQATDKSRTCHVMTLLVQSDLIKILFRLLSGIFETNSKNLEYLFYPHLDNTKIMLIFIFS